MNAAGLIRIISTLLTVLVLVSYALFMYDELGSASKNQSSIAANGAVITVTRDQHGRMTGPDTSTPRIKIDQANDIVTSPGESLGRSVGKSNEWIMRTFAMLFGLLVFGVGGRLLAAYIEKSGFANRDNGPAAGQSEYTASYRQ